VFTHAFTVAVCTVGRRGYARGVTRYTRVGRGRRAVFDRGLYAVWRRGIPTIDSPQHETVCTNERTHPTTLSINFRVPRVESVAIQKASWPRAMRSRQLVSASRTAALAMAMAAKPPKNHAGVHSA